MSEIKVVTDRRQRAEPVPVERRKRGRKPKPWMRQLTIRVSEQDIARYRLIAKRARMGYRTAIQIIVQVHAPSAALTDAEVEFFRHHAD